MTASSSHVYDTAKRLTANGFKRTGYTFKHWTARADGKGAVYSNSVSVKNLTSVNGGTVNLYAQWKPNEYDVKYNGNGHTSGSTASSHHVYDEPKNLTKNGFFKDNGYVFDHWNRQRNNTGTSYADQQSVKNLTSTDGAVITLYAQWRCVLKVSSVRNWYYKGADIPQAEVAKNATAWYEKASDKAGPIKVSRFIYEDGRVVSNPAKLDTSKVGAVKVRYYVTNSYGVKAWHDNWVYVIPKGIEPGDPKDPMDDGPPWLYDSDDPVVYDRYVSDEDLDDGRNAKDTLDGKSVWRGGEHKDLLEDSLDSQFPLPAYDYINE